MFPYTSHSVSIWTSSFLLLLLYLTPKHKCAFNREEQCSFSADKTYGGRYMDCSHSRISLQDLKRFDVDDVTTLIISYNDFYVLPNNSFSRLKDLKCLECVLCNLNVLQVDALEGLGNLEVLNLKENKLRIIEHAFPRKFFNHTPDLRKLYIDDNENYGTSLAYSPFIDIFESLPELTDLSIDSFHNLRIGSEFTKLRNLTYLKVYTHHTKSISNDSLKGFQDSNVKQFELNRGNIPEFNLGLDLFQYLPNVSRLSMTAIHLGNRNFLKMLKPLQGKNIDSILLNGIEGSFADSLEKATQDVVITQRSMTYLTNICVSHFMWYDSHIISFDTEAILSPVWQQCLRSITIDSGVKILVNREPLFEWVRMRAWESVSYMLTGRVLVNQFWDDDDDDDGHDDNDDDDDDVDDDKTEFKQDVEYETEYSVTSPITKATYSIGSAGTYRTTNTRDKPLAFTKWARTTKTRALETCLGYSSIYAKMKKAQAVSVSKSATGKSVKLIGDHREKGLKDLFHRNIGTAHKGTWNGKIPFRDLKSKNMTLSLPPFLKSIVFDGIHSMGANGFITFRKNVVTSLTLSNCNRGMGLVLLGKVVGLDLLGTLNIQGSSVRIAMDFFDSFPSLKKLILRKTQTALGYFHLVGERLLQNIIHLEYLDLAENELLGFPRNHFQNLKYLCLSYNYFSSIPFDFNKTPKLEILDLRGNLFIQLSTNERMAVDVHIRSIEKFKILFSKNHISCSCSSLPFLAWLQNRLEHFDHGGNFTCVSEDGRPSYTGLHQDLWTLWRQCQGQFYLTLSLAIAAILVAFYLGMFVAMKNRTLIVSKMRQMLMPGFRLQAREDFRFDVCIGYANQEGDYVKNILLRYLEGLWHLRTFVHQRDLRQDPLLMSEALRDSRRSLLLITENFLSHYDMAHNVMKVASFFVNPCNPKSLVVMVDESVQHRIPDYVLQVVDEDNIIVVPRLEGLLDYEAKEALKNRLLY